MSPLVALYCRLSPRPDGQYEGVEVQERWGREYAAKMWPGSRVKVFADAGITAAKDDVRRPEYEALKAAITDKQVAHIWTVEQTRISRSLEWFAFADLCDSAGITELHTNRDGIVHLDSIAADFNAVNSRREVRRLTRRVRDRLDVLAAEGRPPGAVVFGYRHGVDEQGRKALFIVPEQADAVRWAASAVLSGWSLTSIAAELDARGFRGAQGARLRVGSVRSFLTSPTIAGRRVHRGVEVGPGTWPPILDAITWQAVKTRLATPRTIQRRDGRGHPVSAALFAGNSGRTGRRYLLTGGLAACGVCGAPLAGAPVTRQGKRIAYLRCHPSRGGKACVGIPMQSVDDLVRDELFAELDQPAFLAALANDDHAGQRDRLLGELTQIEQQLSELASIWANGTLGTAEWQTARVALDEREQQARAGLARLPAPALDVEALTGMRAAWPGMTLGEQREFVRLFIERVIVDRAPPGNRAAIKERVQIVWAHS